ncbi:MAG: helix-turn-helix transcriptional regulator [Reichenbachiella sp.]|uniref:helix-turn-helix transcriptional regulator n=1 Tax=Reichenbachiella sp. TaxID=2184521 RepID=UPI0032664C10
MKRIETLFVKKFQGNKSVFAQACSCDEKTIRKILNGEQFISVNLAFRICKALEITMSELFEGLVLED